MLIQRESMISYEYACADTKLRRKKGIVFLFCNAQLLYSLSIFFALSKAVL